MNLKEVSRKLRHAADVLDELIELEGTKAIAKRIVNSVTKQAPAKLHWTQRPENKAKVLKMAKDNARKRYGKQN